MIPMRAPGLLGPCCDAGILSAAAVHVAPRLARLGGDNRDVALLAAALAVRGVRTGSVCVEIPTLSDTVAPDEDAEPIELPWPPDWAELSESPLVAVGAEAPWRPLRIVDG